MHGGVQRQYAVYKVNLFFPLWNILFIFSLHALLKVIKAGTEIYTMFRSFAILNEKISQAEQLSKMFVDIYSVRESADYMYGKVQSVITQQSPDLFNSTDRKLLREGVFSIDLSKFNQGILNYTNLRDNARDIIGPAIDVSGLPLLD